MLLGQELVSCWAEWSCEVGRSDGLEPASRVTGSFCWNGTMDRVCTAAPLGQLRKPAGNVLGLICLPKIRLIPAFYIAYRITD
jgi:hypothetical protein